MIKLHINESINYNNWEEIGTETLYINDDRLRLPRYEKRIDKIVIQIIPEDDNDELVWTVYYTPEIGMAGFKFVESGFFTSGEAMDYVDNELISKLTESAAYNLSNNESRRKEIADRFGRTFTPDDHYLVCKDDKILNIQVGKKYKCTACNGQRVEIVSINDIYTDDRGDTASLTAYYRGKMIMIGSTQLYESLTEKISEKDYTESKKGIAYKVFQFKDGKLYPPMVANAGNKDTPVGVWLDAEPGEFVEIDGLQRVVQRGAKGDKLRQRIANLDNLSSEERKAEVKKIKSSTLAYRPGWHLGDEPRASQFDREASWEIIDELPEAAVVAGNVTNEDTLAKKGTPGNIGKYFYIKSTGKYAHIFGGKGEVFFPYNFVWAECEYVMDIDYQDEAMSYGYRKGKKFQHSLAGLPRVPEGGSYKYRTNPRPDTVPWVITGAIKVTKLLDDFDVQKILGNKAPERQGGDKTLSELGLKQI